MRKYINADKLITGIEQMKETNKVLSTRQLSEYLQGSIYGFDLAVEKILSIISSFQQEQLQVTNASKMEQEVDLKKEYKKYVEDDPVFSRLTNRNVGLAIARHFWNKGYNARNKK